ncbi:MAG TPA: hypothetical protein VFD04_15535 [Actinomycetes bacterium]|jgi:hypothetical protein|nr:hypothetical protein [Actinomycetes bacterium]
MMAWFWLLIPATLLLGIALWDRRSRHHRLRGGVQVDRETQGPEWQHLETHERQPENYRKRLGGWP